MGRLTRHAHLNGDPAIEYKGKNYPYWHEQYDALSILAHYEDLEEQGRLIELPCKVGDTVWNVNEYVEGFKIRPMEIVLMEIGVKGKKYIFSVYTDDYDNDELVQSYGFDDFGNVLFLTKEEAEAKLKELKEGVE